MAYKTLGEQRANLRNRLGFSGAGAAAGVNQTNLNSILQDAQVALYWTHDWARLRRYETVPIGTSQTLVDYPAAANPERIKAISVLRSNIWSPALPRGIKPQDYSYQSLASWPQKWEPYDQIEIFPITDQAYSLRIFYVMALLPFSEDDHRSTIDDDLIFQLALGMGKSHYRQPDAPLYLKKGESLLMQLKAKSWGQTKFNPNDYSYSEPMIKPVAVDAA